VKLLAIFLGVSVLPVLAQDLSGDWKVTGDIGGYALRAVCTLKQTADHKLTGTCKGEGAGSPLTGEIVGRDVTWKYDLDYNGTVYPLEFSGSMVSDFAIKGEVEAGVVANGPFTARKQQ
jgi:hypothetical protein